MLLSDFFNSSYALYAYVAIFGGGGFLYLAWSAHKARPVPIKTEK